MQERFTLSRRNYGKPLEPIEGRFLRGVQEVPGSNLDRKTWNWISPLTDFSVGRLARNLASGMPKSMPTPGVVGLFTVTRQSLEVIEIEARLAFMSKRATC